YHDLLLLSTLSRSPRAIWYGRRARAGTRHRGGRGPAYAAFLVAPPCWATRGRMLTTSSRWWKSSSTAMHHFFAQNHITPVGSTEVSRVLSGLNAALARARHLFHASVSCRKSPTTSKS